MGEEFKPVGNTDTPQHSAEPPHVAEPTRESTQESRNGFRKPDLAKLSLYASLIFASLIPILQMNLAELNWKYSAAAYVMLIIGAVWTFRSHGVPHLRPLVKGVLTGIIVVALGCLASFATDAQYHRDHSKSSFDELKDAQRELLSQFTNLASDLQGMKDIMATNPAIPANWRDRVVDMERRLVMISTESNELQSWRASNSVALWRGRQELEKQQNAQGQEIASQYQKRLPILEYMIDELSIAMAKVAKLKGDRTKLDYRGLPITLNVVTNFPVENIGLEKNNNWHFYATLKMDNRGVSWFKVSCNGDAVEVGGRDEAKYVYVGVNGKDLYYKTLPDNYTNDVEEAIGTIIESKLQQDENKPQ